MKPKVSIIIPVYNVEKYISKCLDSLVNQTLKEIEIIVVNDGSPDNSQKIIDKYVKKYPDKIKSYIKENGGQGSARNYGIEKTNGEYIGYVDSDDFIEPTMYELLYNKAKKDKLDIVICGNYIVSEDYKYKKEDYFTIKYQTSFENAIFGKMAVWNKIYKKEILTNNKLKFKEKVWYEDLAFTVKALMQIKKIGFIDKPLYDYLLRAGSTMNNSNIERNLEILLAFDEVLNDKNIDKYYDIIELLAIDHIYISTIVRIINAKSDKKVKISTINKIKQYMLDKFPNYRNNRYICTLSRNRKIIYHLLILNQYWLVSLIFKIKRSNIR